MKTCTKCGQEKPLEGFQVRNRFPDGSPRNWRPVCRACHADDTRRWRERQQRNPSTVRDPEPKLPVEPFAAWLRALAAECGSLRQAADRSGLPDRTFGRIVNGRTRTVGLDLVDRATQHAGVSLGHIYPEWD